MSLEARASVDRSHATASPRKQRLSRASLLVQVIGNEDGLLD